MLYKRRLAIFAALIASAASAHAQISIYMSDNFGHVLTVNEGGAGDVSTVANEVIVSPALLDATFPQLDPTTLISGSSNFATGDGYRYLSENVLLKAYNPTGAPSAGNFFVQISENNFQVPLGVTKQLNAAVGGTFTNGSPATGALFMGEADYNNAYFGQTVLTGVNTSFSTGAIPNSFSANLPGPQFNVTNAGGDYSMTDYSDFYLDSGAVVQLNGIVSTTAAVPEPASFAILGIGIVGVLRRRRRS